MEGVIIPDRLGQRLEQVRRFKHRLDVALRIAVKNDARLGGNRPLVIASRERSLLHVSFVHVLVVGRLEVGAGNFIKGHQVVLYDQTGLVFAVLPTEKICHAALTAGKKNGVGRDLAKNEGFSSLLWPEFNQVVVVFHHGHEPQQVEQLSSPAELRLRRFVADRSQQDIDPFFSRKMSAGFDLLVQVGAGDLDWLHAFENEWPGHTTMHNGFVKREFKIGPNAAS